MNGPEKVAMSRADAAFAFAVTQESFGFAEIGIKMGMSHNWARKTVRAWRKAGLLEEVRWVHKERALWRVREAAKQAIVPMARSSEDNMWTAMRQWKSFTPRELAAHAATPETAVTLDQAQGYCRALMAAGYLAVSRKAVPGKTEAIYRLTKNTGPRPPREKRVRAVIDDNTEETIVIGGAQ
jgi:hypothetical protein